MSILCYGWTAEWSARRFHARQSHGRLRMRSPSDWGGCRSSWDLRELEAEPIIEPDGPSHGARMVNEQSNWDLGPPDESSFSGAGTDGSWDEWDDSALGLPDDDVWDAFELDDALEEPEPEHGDFWPERDDEEEVA